MNELQQVLAGDSAHTPPMQIVSDLRDEAAHRRIAGATHSIYEELWHMAFWQQITLDWLSEIETPIPEHASAGFPTAEDCALQPWEDLLQRFRTTLDAAVKVAGEAARIDKAIRCPSRPGMPVRIMSVRDQLESLGAHNAYHCGRIVLLRQLQGLWPPPQGGFSW